MMAKDSYPEQAKSNFVKRLTQSMHSGHFLISYRKKTKSSIFSMKIPLIFLLNYLPL